MDNAPHIAIIAGEASGDLLAAPLISALRRRFPNARFSGIGGAAMQREGFTSLADMSRLSVMGLFEVLRHLPDLMRLKRDLLSHWRADPPDIFIGVDAPDFNLRIARELHQQGVKTVHYVSPSLWAWKAKRIEKIKGTIDLMLCLFPFETAIYEEHGVQAACVGHPLRDRLQPKDKADVEQRLGLSEATRLGIFPGSRQGEIERLMPIYARTWGLLATQYPDWQAVVSCHNAQHRGMIEAIIAEYPRISISEAASDDLMSACDVLLLTSGTITLEAALLARPMVVAYRVNALTAMIAKRLLKIERFSLPNLLSQHDLVPECIQHDCRAPMLAQALSPLLTDDAARDAQLSGFKAISEALPRNVSQHAAQAIATHLWPQ
ncbi:lipid-A-disaccharide synthase [Suttonella sp. R2A3]|uniref:lipid-A-disaccharide synthase n=1 Tax=Suttonella sp. R2A3 TaxID=2908648 RepID=UPI001F25D229|nr:lipid-A-disaccharide synthase [Suttonella sp. R2A3]UJF24827.1 lipid-A-disaccharide synthase [Suttonella sp. R2A3]